MISIHPPTGALEAQLCPLRHAVAPHSAAVPSVPLLHVPSEFLVFLKVG